MRPSDRTLKTVHLDLSPVLKPARPGAVMSKVQPQNHKPDICLDNKFINKVPVRVDCSMGRICMAILYCSMSSTMVGILCLST